MARTKRQPYQQTLDILNAGDGKDEGKTVEPTLADIQKQLADLATSNADLRKENEAYRANQAALLSGGNYTAPQFLNAEPDLKDLPDPGEDSGKYATELAKRFQTAYSNTKTNENIQAEQYREAQTQRELLWQDFQTDYADYAKDPQKVGIASEQVARIAKAKKIDLDKYMFGGGQKQFMADVVTMHNKLFGKPVVEDKEEEDEGDDGEENRTMGIFGGQESGGKPNPGKEERTAKNPGGFSEAIREWQLKNGFHR